MTRVKILHLLLVVGFMFVASACEAPATETEGETSGNNLAAVQAEGTALLQTQISVQATSTQIFHSAETAIAPVKQQMKESEKIFGRNMLVIMGVFGMVFVLIVALIVTYLWMRRVQIQQAHALIDEKIRKEEAQIRYQQGRQHQYRNHQGRPPRDDDYTQPGPH